MAIQKRDGPGWLKPFLCGRYFAHCRVHVSGKNERNHFCLDCEEGPLCAKGLQKHGDHRTLQVRRASHMDAVRICDSQKFLDVSGIQPYTINGAKIIFLLSRPQSRASKSGPCSCEMCGRTISDPVRFCSISCKLACVIANIDDTSLHPIHPLCEESPKFNAGFADRCSPKENFASFCDIEAKKRAEMYQPSSKKSRIIRIQIDQEEHSNPPSPKTPGAAKNSSIQDPKSPVGHLSLVQQCSPQCPSTPHCDEFAEFRGKRKGIPHRSPLF